MTGAVKILNDLQNLFFPATCLCCKAVLSAPQHFICVACSHELPLTGFTDKNDNAAERIFYGRVPIEAATALLWYQKYGPVQHLIHQLKYHGSTKAGGFLGRWLGEELKSSSRFNTIDVVIPMPLQRKRRRKRGYNQTEDFARTLAQILGAAYRDDLLLRSDEAGSVTRKGREHRIMHNGHTFLANVNNLQAYNHVLITDDVVTTGTTLESAAKAMRKAAEIKISIATMAITY